MPIFFNILTGVIALTGCVSLLISGEINPVISLAGIALFYGYYRLMTGMSQAPKWSVSLLSVITLILFLIDFFGVSDDYLLSVANLTIFFQAIKSFDLREPWDHLQVCFMSLLQLIITSELTHSIAFGVLFILFLVALVDAIVLAHFIKSGLGAKISVRRILIRISLLTFFLTCIIFIVTPRITGGLWGKAHQKGIKTAGFSEKVDFGSFGDVKLDPTVVMRVELSSNSRGPYYWRGMTLDYFDGVSWREVATKKSLIFKRDGFFTIRPFSKEKAVIQKIYLEPIDTDVIFGLSEIAALEVNARAINVDEAQAVFLPYKKGKEVYYTVYSINELPSGDSRSRPYLQVPGGMGKVRQLAFTVTSGKNDELGKARAVENYLRDNYTYSLNTSEPPLDMRPIEDFLFHSKKGYCEHYATAMVMMLRLIGIPSRIVNGFYGGEPNAFGGYMIVRQSDAHSWVEAVIDKKWMRFDPTPAVYAGPPSKVSLYLDMLRMKWNRYVVSFSSLDQREIMHFFTLPFRLPGLPQFRVTGFKGFALHAAVAVLMLVGIMFAVFKALKWKRYGFVTAEYIKFRKELKKKGMKISPCQTPQELRKAAIHAGLNGDVSDFLRMYEEFRFGNKTMTDEEKVKYHQLLKEIKRNG